MIAIADIKSLTLRHYTQAIFCISSYRLCSTDKLIRFFSQKYSASPFLKSSFTASVRFFSSARAIRFSALSTSRSRKYDRCTIFNFFFCYWRLRNRYI